MPPTSPAAPIPPSRCIVGIGGGSGSGKTTFARALAALLPSGTARVLDHDAYYRDLSHLPPADRARTDFDHPDALESDLLAGHLDALRAGRAIAKPRYDFTTHTRLPDTERVEPTPVVVVEGILVLGIEKLRDRFDLALFVDAPADIRLLRRLHRDVAERGRSLEMVASQYLGTVRPAHELFVAPSRARADLIVPGDADFATALEMTAAMVLRRIR